MITMHLEVLSDVDRPDALELQHLQQMRELRVTHTLRRQRRYSVLTAKQLDPCLKSSRFQLHKVHCKSRGAWLVIHMHEARLLLTAPCQSGIQDR